MQSTQANRQDPQWLGSRTRTNRKILHGRLPVTCRLITFYLCAHPPWTTEHTIVTISCASKRQCETGTAHTYHLPTATTATPDSLRRVFCNDPGGHPSPPRVTIQSPSTRQSTRRSTDVHNVQVQRLHRPSAEIFTHACPWYALPIAFTRDQ